jgi:hypothetical protein
VRLLGRFDQSAVGRQCPDGKPYAGPSFETRVEGEGVA